MPKYTPELEKAKVKSLIKLHAKKGLNQTRVAEVEGVTPSAICHRMARPIVKKTMAELLNKIGVTDTYLNRKLKEGIESKKVVGYLNNKVDGVQKTSDEFIEVPDMHCRHKYIVTALELKGHIKHNGNGKGVNVSTIIFSFRDQSGLFSKAEAEALSPKRS